MAADSSSSSVADQLSVTLGQEYRVKLGRSFTFPEQNSFHTIKYDFKPQSVDSTKPGHLKVTDDEVNVSLPVMGQGDSIEDFTHFRGNKKPCTKECILIINTRTGEAILEKISNNVNLKAVRDGRKPAPVNRDRSVSPSPFAMQSSKGHLSSKSQLSSGSHRHLTPSPIPTPTPPTTNNSTPSATKGGGDISASGNNPTPGNGGKKGQKRQPVKSKTPKTPATVATSAKQESKARNGSKPKAKKKSESSSKQASMSVAPKTKVEPAMAAAPQALLNSSQAAMTSMPLLGVGMELVTREISPIHSNNPTPEPIRPPSRKKQKLTLSGNSSSSSSESSDSDSEGEESMSQAPPTQQPPAQFSSIPVTRVATVTNSQPQDIGSMPILSHSQPIAQKGYVGQKSHPGLMSQPQIPPPPKQRLTSGSSSESDSDSSSGSTSSDSSSDSSDEENDKEVAALSGAPVEPRSVERSYSMLKTDLQLSSDSGSSSD